MATNKLQQAAEKRKAKHVTPEGADLWIKGYDAFDVQVKLAIPYIGLLYMGMKDLHQWLKEIEEYVTGGERVSTMQDLHMEIQALKQGQKDMKKRLDDALSEEPTDGTQTTTTDPAS